MTTLTRVFQEKEKINQYAQSLGFKNLAIHDKESFSETDPFCLLVDINREFPGATSANTIELQEQLEQLLQCEVLIILRETLKDLGKSTVLERSCRLESENDLKQLFEAASLDEVHFTPSIEYVSPTPTSSAKGKAEQRSHSSIASAEGPGFMSPRPVKKSKPSAPEDFQRKLRGFVVQGQEIEHELRSQQALFSGSPDLSEAFDKFLQSLHQAAQSGEEFSQKIAITSHAPSLRAGT